MSVLEILFETLAGGCLLGAMALWYQEIGEVNRKLPENQQIPYFFFHMDKVMRIKREYKRLYPLSRIDQLRTVLEVLGIVFVFLALWAAGSFRHSPPH